MNRSIGCIRRANRKLHPVQSTRPDGDLTGQDVGNWTTDDVKSSHELQRPREECVIPLNSGKMQFPAGQTNGRAVVEKAPGVVRPALTEFIAASDLDLMPVLEPEPISDRGSLAATGMRTV